MRESYSLPRLYISDPLRAGAEIQLSSEQAHYVSHVLRKRVGETVRVFNAQGGEWRADILKLDKRRVVLGLQDQLRLPISCPDIWLCFAPLKRQRNSFILEKATELGVGRLCPVITARTQFPKIRLDKMRQHIIEAAEQTERLDIPDLQESVILDTLLAEWDTSRVLIFADEAGDVPPAGSVLAKISLPCALLIGPEGGFTPEERARLRAHVSVKAVSLGPRILRADTAALSLLTLWQATQGDWAPREMD